MKYQIVETSSAKSLEAHINRFLAEGWKLQGGVSSVYNASGYYYMQAIVKESV